jgi:hypothetical protein
MTFDRNRHLIYWPRRADYRADANVVVCIEASGPRKTPELTRQVAGLTVAISNRRAPADKTFYRADKSLILRIAKVAKFPALSL